MLPVVPQMPCPAASSWPGPGPGVGPRRWTGLGTIPGPPSGQSVQSL